MAHAHCILDTKGYKYALRIGLCNSYYFSTAKLVSGTRLNVTLYLLCLSFEQLAAWTALVRTDGVFEIPSAGEDLYPGVYHVILRSWLHHVVFQRIYDYFISYPTQSVTTNCVVSSRRDLCSGKRSSYQNNPLIYSRQFKENIFWVQFCLLRDRRCEKSNRAESSNLWIWFFHYDYRIKSV